MSIKYIAFDLVNTVYDVSKVPEQELKNYVTQVRADKWAPLTLPPSWEHIPLHTDSAEGLKLLGTKYKLVAMSNLPYDLIRKMAKNSGIKWDYIVPIIFAQAYKPNLSAYGLIFDLCKCHPSEVMMVTANKTAGDLEAAAQLGMHPKLIREPGSPRDLIELAKQLGV